MGRDFEFWIFDFEYFELGSLPASSALRAE